MTISNRHVNRETLILAGLAGWLAEQGFPGRHVFPGDGGRKALQRLGILLAHRTNPRPDAWVVDGTQAYAIEIGKTTPDKWRHAFPIVHVTFEGAISIFDAKFTPFEQAMVEGIREISELDLTLDAEAAEDYARVLAEVCEACGAGPNVVCVCRAPSSRMAPPKAEPKRRKRKQTKRRLFPRRLNAPRPPTSNGGTEGSI